MDGLVVIIDRCRGKSDVELLGCGLGQIDGPLTCQQRTPIQIGAEVRDCQWENRIFEADG